MKSSLAWIVNFSLIDVGFDEAKIIPDLCQILILPFENLCN
jgi:hypothetical protein